MITWLRLWLWSFFETHMAHMSKQLFCLILKRNLNQKKKHSHDFSRHRTTHGSLPVRVSGRMGPTAGGRQMRALLQGFHDLSGGEKDASIVWYGTPTDSNRLQHPKDQKWPKSWNLGISRHLLLTFTTPFLSDPSLRNLFRVHHTAHVRLCPVLFGWKFLVKSHGH